MPQKDSRKCSVCQQSGHTKRTCLPPAAFGVRAGSKKTVYVKISNEKTRSANVIDLRDARPAEAVWDKISVYGGQTKKNKLSPPALDLAALVRAANARANLLEAVKKINFGLKAGATALALKTKLIKSKSRKMVYENIRASLIAAPWQAARRHWSWRRSAYASLVLFLVFTVSFPAAGYYSRLRAAETRAVDAGTRAFFSLQASTAAAFQSDINTAGQKLTYALQDFSLAHEIVEKDFKWLIEVVKLLPIIGPKVESQQNLLIAGNHLALGNAYFIKGIEATQTEGELAFTDRLEILQNHLRGAIAQYREAANYLNKVEFEAIPVEYQKLFAEFKVLLAAFIDDAEDLAELSKTFKTVFGGDSFRRYLLVFQNQHELRPTGGFMGSFAVLDVQKGKVLRIEVPGGGTYDLRGQLTEFVKPPLPLQLVNSRWEFQDANWFPDFAASAQKMEWFYEKARGSTVDGVIALNASVLERMLRVLGPVAADGILFAGEDALVTLQKQVEVEFDRPTEQPKEVLSEILDGLLGHLQNLDSASVLRLLAETHEALRQKEVQLYINESKTQDRLRSFGWTGEVLPIGPQQDYLAVINTNLQGQKSDAKIKETITHEAVIGEAGDIIDTVVIERTHTGNAGEQFYGGANISFTRVYVPEGAELLAAGGFAYPPDYAFHVPEAWYEEDADLARYESEEAVDGASGTRISREFDKTAFGNWIITMPGETSAVYFRYKLPYKASVNEGPESNLDKWQSVFMPALNQETSRYSLLVQKQSGTNSHFSSTIIYPSDWLPVWKSDEEISMALNGARYEVALDSDRVIGIVLEKTSNQSQ